MASNGHLPSRSEGFVHQALIYRSKEELVEAALPYMRDGIRGGEPVLVRVRRANLEALRAALGAEARAVDLQPAEDWYETPTRTRGKFLAWAASHSNGHRARLLGEPPWPLASPAGIREWARHEAIINLAFAGSPITFVCPYDRRSLPSSIIEHAESTHPEIYGAHGTTPGDGFVDPATYCRRLDRQIPARSGAPAAELRLAPGKLSSVRRLVEREAMRAGLSSQRTEDMVTAVNQVASNALVHGEQPASVRVWREAGELAFEIIDSGPGIADPLAGQLKPDLNRVGGWGLWMARMLADAIEVRSDSSGSAVAVHASLPR